MEIKISRINIHHSKIVDGARAQHQIKTICVVKVDHIGDFIMAMPAFQALRNEFPSAAIDLVCARWNVAIALASGLFSEVHPFDFFPENPSKPESSSSKTFPLEVASRQYDLAIDLRVQGETRALLANIRARWYAGIGQVGCDSSDAIVLPRQLDEMTVSGDQRFFSINQTTLCQPGSTVADGSVVRFTRYEKHKNLMILGPVPLMAGTYRACFLLSFVPRIITRQPIVVLGAFTDEKLIVEHRLRVTRNHDPCMIEFSVQQDHTPVDLRVRIRRGHFTRIDFRGVLIHKASGWQQPEGCDPARHSEARPARSRLHITEQLLLLVNLVAGRLNGVSFPGNWHFADVDDRQPSIAIAPLSNSAIRDWPFEHYEHLISRLYEFYRGEIVLLGSANQAAALGKLKNRLQTAGVQQVVVEAGMPMLEVIARLSRTSLVISNNSGIAHVAGALGRPVVAICSASHDVDEWGAVGSNVWLIQAEIGCKRCHFDFIENCHNDRRCTRDLLPEDVFGLIRGDVVWKGNHAMQRAVPT